MVGMTRLPPFVSYAAISAGAAVALVDTFYGNATSATNTYGWLLRGWAILMAIPIILFALVIGLDRGPRRFISLGLLLTTLIAVAEPAERLWAIGWHAP
jgi:hypothetical protein